MRRKDSAYSDVLAFLERVEDPKRAKMNRRKAVSAQVVVSLRRRFPGIPDEYIAYLREVGWGSFRECQFMVYSDPGTPDEILGEGVFYWLSKKTRVLCFGDNFSGDLSGFLPDKKWAVVELWHDSREIYRVKKPFGEYIRDRMVMGPKGEDRRVRRTGGVA